MPIHNSFTQRPEHAILLLCARSSQTAEQQALFASILGEKLEWGFLVERLHRNRLVPLFLHHLQGHESLVPTSVLQKLRLQALLDMGRRLTLLGELQGILKLLESEQIPVLTYKGPTVAQLAYGSPGLRPFTDLDLLISPQHRQKAIAVLEANNYKQEITQRLPPHLQAQRDAVDHEVTLVPVKSMGVIDLHWAITPPYDLFPLEFEAMWERRVEMTLGTTMPTPCREDLILTLCIHGIKHVWQRLEWISCLLGILQNRQQESLDWDHLERTCVTLGNKRILYIGLRLALDLNEFKNENLTQANPLIPESVLREIKKDVTVTRLTEQVWRQLFHHRQRDEKFFALPQFVFSIRAREGVKARRDYIFTLVRSYLVPHHEDAAYNGKWTFIIYAQRIIRIIMRRLWRLLVLRHI